MGFLVLNKLLIMKGDHIKNEDNLLTLTQILSNVYKVKRLLK
jgi:hypothetical protein